MEKHVPNHQPDDENHVINLMVPIHPDLKVSAYAETRRQLDGTLCILEVKQVIASMSTSQWDALCRSAILSSMKIPFSSAKGSESPSRRACTVMSKEVKTYVHVCYNTMWTLIHTRLPNISEQESENMFLAVFPQEPITKK